jgi:hypothetical protein
MELKAKEYANPREQAFDYVFSNWDPEHIQLNKAMLEKMLNILLPCKVINFIDRTSLVIHTETGSILDSNVETDSNSSKWLSVSTRRIKSIDDFNPLDFKSKYLYIYKMSLATVAEGTKPSYVYMEMRLAEFNISKKVVSFTIDENVYERFQELSDKMAINKSKFVENKIKELLAQVK